MLYDFQKRRLPPFSTPVESSSCNFVELYEKQSEVVIGQQRDLEDLKQKNSRLRSERDHLQGIVDSHNSSVSIVIAFSFAKTSSDFFFVVIRIASLLNRSTCW